VSVKATMIPVDTLNEPAGDPEDQQPERPQQAGLFGAPPQLPDGPRFLPMKYQ
jgi:hypothetical protein